MSYYDYESWRSRRPKQPGLLKGVRAICDYACISNTTFYTWKDHHDFPIASLPDGRWCTTKTLIDDWIFARWKAQREEKNNQDEPVSHSQ